MSRSVEVTSPPTDIRDRTMWRDESLDPAVTAWLVAPTTRGLLDEVLHRHRRGDDALAIGSWLRRNDVPADRASTLSSVVAASRRAWESGLPDGTWWTPAAAEQASHPDVASWRARRLAGRVVADVTAGCGADTLALSAVSPHVLAVELDAARLPLLAHNVATVHGSGRVDVLRGDATRPAWTGFEAWFADPGRREGGRRLRRLGELHPGVPQLLEVAPAACMVVPPALDLGDPDLPTDAELEFVQLDGRLTEACLWTRDLVSAPRRASDAATGRTVSGTGEARLPTGGAVGPGEWLVEPDPAIVRARLVAEVGADRDWRRLDARRALVVAPQPDTGGWGRAGQVLATCAARPRAVRDALDSLDEAPVEVVLHGLDADPRRFLNDLGNPPTGPSGHRIHLVRTADGSVAVVTSSAVRQTDALRAPNHS